ncbi:MAG TPA: DUF2382 domain-containing protein [Pseudonocardiaceae bacterium]|nr:DUF2382 domain-containing protein [Pseudonocardiaceae bacterium]
MTRSEEWSHVGTKSNEVGKARLRKYIVTEKRRHRGPGAPRGGHPQAGADHRRQPRRRDGRRRAHREDHEVTPHEEGVVTHKETVPVGRVRLGTETVTEDEQVNETVRKEHIESQSPGTDAGGRPQERQQGQQARKDR